MKDRQELPDRSLAPSRGPRFENPPLIHNNFDGGLFIYFWFSENEQARSRRLNGNEYLS